MGNTPSKDSSGGPAKSPAPPTAGAPSSLAGSLPPLNHVSSNTEKRMRRRESIPALPANKATVRPSASLESATASTSHSSTRSARESLRSQSGVQPPPPPPPTVPTPHLKPVDSAPQDIMGNQESKPIAAAKKEQTPPARSSPLPRPIDVPSDRPPATDPETLSPELPHPTLVDESYQLPAATQFSRPPRLPLPIEQELHTPGSPIISPGDLSAPIEPIEGDPVLGLPRRSSVLSSTTIDDDDLGDDLQSLEGGPRPPVPTLLEWREGGEKVYVTGTFAGWDRKFRLQKNGPSKHPGALSALISLQPGTHHVRFIVDNDMKLSKYMPTAVDFTNFLVNYIEVAPPVEPEPAQAPPVSAPVAAPPGTQQVPTATQPRPIEYRAPPGVHPPQILPPTPELIPIEHPPKDATPKAGPSDPQLAERRKLKPAPQGPQKVYHQVIPRFLLDLDATEETAQFARASAVVSTAPVPPTLPMFLAKSILNGTTPMKDDASVLNMPNHTVLNHLATSSIRNKVLATSATTRYKQKFLTTIMYKPTSELSE